MVTIDWETVDAEIKELFATQTEVRSFSRDELLLSAGSVCDHLYLIEEGMLRNFYLDPKGNDITHWFSGKDTLVTAPPSFFKREPSFFSIEAIEDTTARVITYQQLEQVFALAPKLERFGRELAIETMITLGQKVIDLQTKTAEERYNDLLATHPNIFQTAKLGHIAGYLGITQQSLSRIRANHP